MRAILPDNNIQGQFQRLFILMESEEWRETWTSLNLAVESFHRLGLLEEAPDEIVWQTCQREQIVLFTANRRQATPDSLEATIRRYNSADSLPVITLADADRIMVEKAYAERVVEKLLDYLLQIDNLRGTGRLYVP